MMPTEFLTALGNCVHGITVSHGLTVSLFLAGLVGGATHCTMMCGPFVLSQTGTISRVRDSFLFPYHLGRITTYVALAMLLSGVLNLAFLFLPVRALIVAPVLMLAGLIFLASAFPAVLRMFPWTVHVKAGVPYRWISKAVSKLMERKDVISKYFLGILLGFIPCGLILSALMAASTAPNALQAGVAMAAFGVGTMPALVFTALGGKILQLKYPVAMQNVARGMMVFSALWLFALAGMILI